MKQFFVFFFSILTEMAGCYAFWAWLRLGKTPLWLIPGTVCLWIFSYLLTYIEADTAGRAYAIYSGIYVVGSYVWTYFVEGQTPDRWDIMGAILCLMGAAVIIFGHRSIS